MAAKWHGDRVIGVYGTLSYNVFNGFKRPQIEMTDITTYKKEDSSLKKVLSTLLTKKGDLNKWQRKTITDARWRHSPYKTTPRVFYSPESRHLNGLGKNRVSQKEPVQATGRVKVTIGVINTGRSDHPSVRCNIDYDEWVYLSTQVKRAAMINQFGKNNQFYSYKFHSMQVGPDGMANTFRLTIKYDPSYSTK